MSDMSDHKKCGMPGCNSEVPAELTTEAICVTHYLIAAENVCTAIRRESIPGGPDVPRRTEIRNYVASSSMTLARLGSGSVRLSDETKKRILTTFLTLMIVRENLDRIEQAFRPRRPVAKVEAGAELVAA